jgi:hypothetical protein
MHNRHYLSFATILSTCLACQRPIHISFLFFSQSLLLCFQYVREEEYKKKYEKRMRRKKKIRKISFDHDHMMIMMMIIMMVMNISTRLLRSYI